MIEYNPFDKELDKLELSDLNILIDNEIIEGWYIEYKSLIPKLSNGKLDNIKISKSISSFANTKGGWIFWGVKCENNKPTLLEGIDITDFGNFEDQVSQVINSNISPKPFYHFKTIQLENEKIIFVIKIDESPTPPYITSQGIIYQRENNECKPIRDRYIIEKLNEKTENYYDSIERFSNFDLPETKGQGDWNQTYLELYLFPLPFNNFQFKEFYSSNFFKNIASRFYNGVTLNHTSDETENSIDLNLNFNSVYSSERSIIIRPLKESNLIYKSTTVELFDNGNLKFLIPIFEFKTDDIPSHYKNSKTIEYILDKYSPHQNDDFDYNYNAFEIKYPKPIKGLNQSRTKTDFTNHIKFIDGHEIVLTMILITSIYRGILEDNDFDFTNDIGFRARITDCWRKFIFFDNDDYLEKLKLYNIPLTPKNEIEIPEFRKGHAYTVDLSEEYSFITLAKFIMEGIGLPDSDSIKFNEIIEKSIARFKKDKSFD